jgi:hypothetical protein
MAVCGRLLAPGARRRLCKYAPVVRDGTRYVMSGGGGTALCSHFRGVCAPGSGAPEDRGALFHAVQITLTVTGAVSGRVLQAFAPADAPPRIIFGD